MSKTIRLNKLLADAGICSRRKADELIENGLIKVNGRTETNMGVKVDPATDKVIYKGKSVRLEEEKIYLAFHKPANVVTTTSDPEGRPTVLDYFPQYKKFRLFPVGRLDWATEGLLFVTNDGEFSNSIAHPKSTITKTYLAKVDGLVTDEKLKKLVRGVSIPGGGTVKALNAEIVPHGSSTKYHWVKITITEGKNRQVRKMFEKIGFDVRKLTRISIGGLKLGAIKPGMHRVLKANDLLKIFEKKATEKATTTNKKATKKRTTKNAQKTTRTSPKTNPRNRKKVSTKR